MGMASKAFLLRLGGQERVEGKEAQKETMKTILQVALVGARGFFILQCDMWMEQWELIVLGMK